jgi:hypothetical protein
MDAYWAAKAALFAWPGLRSAVINIDGQRGASLAAELSDKGLDLWTCSGSQRARLQACDIRSSGTGMVFAVREAGEQHTVHSPVAGNYNVANLLAFSSDAFAALPTSSNVTITLKDTATNLGANATALAAAITQYGQQKQIIKLQINDTAANLGANIDGLETVADAITGATTPDLSRIDINQINSSGVADSTSLVKVSFAQYTSDSNMLAYIKADTSNAQGVEIDAGIDSAGINNAKTIGFQLQVAQSVLNGGTPPLPTSAMGAGTVTPMADVTKLDKYSDVAKVNITFNTAAAYTNYANVADTDIAGYTVGINILA